MTRRGAPSSLVFADGSKLADLALHPSAIGVSYLARDTPDADAEIVDGVAVLEIEGPLSHKPDSSGWCFWENYEDISTRFHRLLESDEVGAILLKFDSPGGDVAGLYETVRAMRAAKELAGKPVFAYVDEDCYSAAFALAMVADEVYLPPAGNVGSIGVITVMADLVEADRKDGIRVEVIASGAQKTDGHPHVPLSPDAIKRTQKRVDGLAAMFFEIVAESRKLSIDTVKGFEAGVFTGQAAVAAGLADGVLSLEDVLTTAAAMLLSVRSTSAPKETTTMGLLAATKAINDAQKALTAAKTDADRAKAAGALVAAEAKAAATSAEVKYKHTKKSVEVIETEDDPTVDDEEETDEGSSGATDDGENAGGDAGEKAIAAYARSLTGKTSAEEVIGALTAFGQSNARIDKLSAEVAALRSKAGSGELATMIDAGIKARKLAPAQRAWAEKQSPKALKAYLDATPPLVHGLDGSADGSSELTEASVSGTPAGAVTAEMAKIWSKQGYKPSDYPGLLAKMNGGAASGANGVAK